MVTISIALATYNGERYLREQLDSFAAQTLLPDELVVGDDGSTDATLDILTDFARAASFPVRVLPRDRRRGFADNFLNVGAACTGDLIAFSDQDDVWLPEKLALCSRAMVAADALASLHVATLTDGALTPIGVHDQGITRSATFEPLALDPYATGWGNTLMCRRELLDLVPPADRPPQPERGVPMSHDTWIYTLAAALGRVVHLVEPLCLYRQHGANVSGAARPPLRERLISALTVPLARHRARLDGYERFEQIFIGLSRAGDAQLAARAARAAARYGERALWLRLRIRVYTAGAVWNRVRALLDMYRIKPGGRASDRGLNSVMKDVVLGVCGLGRET